MDRSNSSFSFNIHFYLHFLPRTITSSFCRAVSTGRGVFLSMLKLGCVWRTCSAVCFCRPAGTRGWKDCGLILGALWFSWLCRTRVESRQDDLQVLLAWGCGHHLSLVWALWCSRVIMVFFPVNLKQGSDCSLFCPLFCKFVWMKWCLMSSDVGQHISDKLRPMPKHGSVNLYVHGSQKAR